MRKMKNTCILLLAIINTACCYYLYNPSTNDLIVLQSLNKVPKGYRLVPPPRDRKRSRLSKDKTIGYCNDAGFMCDSPYNKSSTYQFECTGDDQCPTSYKCCPQKCFLHKICVKASGVQKKNESKRRPYERQGECEKWPYHCNRPYRSSFTQKFKCDSDSQCPRNFRCCQQNCFVHRICSRVKSQAKEPPKKLIEEDRAPEEEEPNKSKPVTYEEAFTSPTASETVGETATENTTEENDKEDYTEETQETTHETTSSTEKVDDEEEVILEATAADLTTTQEEEEGDSETTTIQEETTNTENDMNNIETTSADEEVTETQTEPETTTIYIPKRTTLDSNAINPEYAEYYYHYDNVTDVDDDQYDYDDEDNYDDNDDSK